MFGSRSEYLDAPEEEVLEQHIIWEAENAAAVDKEREVQAQQDALKRTHGL